MRNQMEFKILSLLAMSVIVLVGIGGIIASSSDSGDGAVPTDVSSIVEGFSSNKILGLGEDEVDVDLSTVLTSPTGVVPTTAKQVELPPAEIVATTRTDANGYYRFDNVPAGQSYFITYNKAGFLEEAYFEVAVEPQTLVTLEPVPLLETRFDTAAGIISGAVIDAANGRPLGGVLIRARAGINNLLGTVVAEDSTDDNGFYSLDMLDAGSYTLEALRSGYQTVYFDAFVFDADGDPLTPNETVIGTIALVPDDLAGELFSVTGSVFAAFNVSTDSGPFPLGGAAVLIREGINNTAGTITTEGFTNSTGFYSFETLAAGQYTLEGVLSEFNPGYLNVPLGRSLTNQNVTLMPLIAETSQQLTVVLSWATTTNLDGQLTQVEPEVVRVPRLNDDLSGFGPETTLLKVIASGQRYEYFVNDATGFPVAASTAQVRAYRGNSLIFTFELPLDDEDAWSATDWHVFTIETSDVSDEYNIVPVNDLLVGPSISIDDAFALEGELDEFNFVSVPPEPLDFTVSLNFLSSNDIVLDMVATDGEETKTFIDENQRTITASAAQVADNDYLPSNFLYSVDGGNTWIDATGPNGTVVTIPADRDSILVRVFPVADNELESNEYFTLGVSEVIFGVVSDFSDTGNGIILSDDVIL